MSYAEVAAKGPKQSDEEVIPHAIPEIAHSDSGVHSIDSLSSAHISSAPSYADQQLESERAEEAEEEGKRDADEMAQEARDFTQQAEKELSRLEQESGQKYDQFSHEAKDKYESWKKQASKDYEKVKKQAGVEGRKGKENAKKAEKWADDNKGNPVVIGNAVVIAALGGALGISAYRMHQAGSLTWNVIGAWAGAVGLFAVGDYYVSQHFFKKYPPKQ